MSVFTPIYTWYKINKRQLPWRNTKNPYLIWLSEIILQQTKVNQGLPYFNNFVKAYPSVVDLANANMDEVLKLWQGLGYYNRAKNMLHTAQQVRDVYQGVFPPNYQGLINLKGIGPYTAAAIASFAYNQPHAVVDGNVYRVLSRVLGITDDIATTNAKKVFDAIAHDILPTKNAALHNQAMMEFGAIICTPKKPQCSVCVLQANCIALAQNMVGQLPVKSPKKKPTNKYHHYILPKKFTSFVFLKKRTGAGIWNGLYELPLLETDMDTTEDEVKKLLQIKFDLAKTNLKLVYNQKHVLTHQIIYAKFWQLAINEQELIKLGYQKTNIGLVQQYPVPRLLEKFFNDILLVNSTK